MKTVALIFYLKTIIEFELQLKKTRIRCSIWYKIFKCRVGGELYWIWITEKNENISYR